MSLFLRRNDRLCPLGAFFLCEWLHLLGNDYRVWNRGSQTIFGANMAQREQIRLDKLCRCFLPVGRRGKWQSN